MTGRVTVASATAGNANERTPLVINDDPTVYSYDPEDVDDGREVDVWKPGKSSFNATVSVLGAFGMARLWSGFLSRYCTATD